MAALTADRDTLEKASSWGMRHGYAATDSTQYYKGGIVCLSQSTGKVVKGSTATGLITLGRCCDNKLTGTSTTKTVEMESGIFRYGNSGGGDAIAADDIGKACYVVDDQTVALTDGTGTRSAAGTVYDVDSTGVWVAIKFPLI